MDILLAGYVVDKDFEVSDEKWTSPRRTMMDKPKTHEAPPEVTTTEAATLLETSYWRFRRKYAPRLESRRLYGNTGPCLFKRNQVLELLNELKRELV